MEAPVSLPVSLYTILRYEPGHHGFEHRLLNACPFPKPGDTRCLTEVPDQVPPSLGGGPNILACIRKGQWDSTLCNTDVRWTLGNSCLLLGRDDLLGPDSSTITYNLNHWYSGEAKRPRTDTPW